MEMNSPNDVVARSDRLNSTRVRHIVVPARNSFFHPVIIAFAISFGGLCGWFGTGIVLSSLVEHSDEPSGWCYLCMAIGALLGSCIGALLVNYIYYKGRMRHSWRRMERLDALAQSQELETALPHRALEQVFLSRFPTQGRIRRLVAGLPPGVTIAVNMPRPHPASHAVPFEPVALDDSDESLKDLVRLNLEKKGFPVNAQTLTLGLYGKMTKISKEARWPRGLDFIFRVTLLSWLVFQEFIRPSTAALILMFWAIVPRASRIAMGQWWLVPGGILFRKSNPWRRRTKVGMISPDTSPLLVHYKPRGRLGYAYAVANGRAVVLPCPQWTAWPALAAWISTAPRPTREEILAFFGSDAEWADA